MLHQIALVGSDVNNYRCIYCGANDRLRHLFMYFDKLNFWVCMKQKNILHFAPEIKLQQSIIKQNPNQYVLADIAPKEENIKQIDMTAIPFESETFDIVIANHVLEHIEDYTRALSEVYRVLKTGGIAILQTPYAKNLKHHFEITSVHTNTERLNYYGQSDHVRIFSEQQFFQDLLSAGFTLTTKNHIDLFKPGLGYYYGVNENEKLILVQK